MGVSLVFIILLAVLATGGCSSRFRDFWATSENQIGANDRVEHTFSAKFLGVTSFIFQNDESAMLIDGFISRPEHALFRAIKPDLNFVAQRLRENGISVRQSCDAPFSRGRKLDAAIALHGHFDHALETPLAAMLTGATLFHEEQVQMISEQTQKLYPTLCPEIKTIKLISRGPGTVRTKGIGSMKLTTIEVRHSENWASKMLEAIGSGEDWVFPTHLSRMKLGVSLAVHLDTPKGNLLIMPTAGVTNTEFRRPGLCADVVFLGIGGAGHGTRAAFAQYWTNVVRAVGARRVIPVHWDAFSPPLGAIDDQVSIPFYERHDRTLRWMQQLAAQDPVIQLASIPIGKAFDPFQGLTQDQIEGVPECD